MTIKQVQTECNKRGHKVTALKCGLVMVTTKQGNKICYNSYNELFLKFLKPVTEPAYPETIKIKNYEENRLHYRSNCIDNFGLFFNKNVCNEH